MWNRNTISRVHLKKIEMKDDKKVKRNVLINVEIPGSL